MKELNQILDPKTEDGRSYYLHLKKGDMPGYVIIPGSPERTAKIAANWENVKDVAHNRHYISKKGIGMGDVKLISVIGFYTGTAVLYAIIVFSLIACIVYSLIQMARKKVTAKSFVAFGPFVAIGTIVDNSNFEFILN